MDSSSSNSSFLLRKSYLNSDVIGDFSRTSIAGSIQSDDNSVTSHPCAFTQAELEEYSRLQYIHHQTQSSYAQSEGYHSYVSSTDSTSATPFLDRPYAHKQNAHQGWAELRMRKLAWSIGRPDLFDFFARNRIHFERSQLHNDLWNRNSTEHCTSSINKNT